MGMEILIRGTENSKVKKLTTVFLLLGWTAALGVSGCVSTLEEQTNVLATPQHHVYSGFKLMQRRHFLDAEREFKLALQISPNYSAAQRGLGLVRGMQGDFNLGFQMLRQAEENAVGKEDRALARVGLMRLQTLQSRGDWLAKVEELFARTVGEVELLPEAYYYLGLAYKQANILDEAERALQKVVDINTRLVPQAQTELELLRRLEE
jgi:tetratricopeptide (TPR) repeat protein